MTSNLTMTTDFIGSGSKLYSVSVWPNGWDSPNVQLVAADDQESAVETAIMYLESQETIYREDLDSTESFEIGKFKNAMGGDDFKFPLDGEFRTRCGKRVTLVSSQRYAPPKPWDTYPLRGYIWGRVYDKDLKRNVMGPKYFENWTGDGRLYPDRKDRRNDLIGPWEGKK